MWPNNNQAWIQAFKIQTKTQYLAPEADDQVHDQGSNNGKIFQHT